MSDSCAVDPRPTVREKAPEGLKLHDLYGPPATRPSGAGGGQADHPGQAPVMEDKETEK